MAERTPEELNRMIEGLDSLLVFEEAGKQLPEDFGPLLSEAFSKRIRSALRRARYEGVREGIEFATGEGELPDITAALNRNEEIGEALDRNLGPLRAELNSPGDYEFGGII